MKAEKAIGAPALSEDTRRAWLRLIRSENVGPMTFRQLVNRFGGARAALDALPELSARGGRRIRIADEDSAAEEMARAERLGARFVCMGEPDYPQLLRLVEYAPPVLAIMGSAEVFGRSAIAMVGARNASLAGAKLTRQFAASFGEAGYVVVSGLARGIDTAAHEGSLETGTIGVFAGGLDRPYPEENKPLMRRIVDGGGGLMSEMPFGWAPRARDFPRRNRLVAGLGLGLVVMEAALRSGSLISAGLANELGRLVFAIPGSPLDPRSTGTNKLLKDGAIIATEPADILNALQPLDARLAPKPLPLAEASESPPVEEPAEGERERLLEALGPTPVDVDNLIAHTGAKPGAIQLVLLELDLAGRLERHPGNRVSLLL